MQWTDIDFRPSNKKLRQFAALCLLIALLPASRLLFAPYNAFTAAACVALCAVGMLGLVRPRAVRPIWVGWSAAAFPIGRLVSHVVLAVLYFGLFTPLGLLFRLLGRDALQLRPPRGKTTYWTAKPRADRPQRYLQQF